jgi:hypothetical protein
VWAWGGDTIIEQFGLEVMGAISPELPYIKPGFITLAFPFLA